MIKLSFCKFSQSVRLSGQENLSFAEPRYTITLYSEALEHGFLALVKVTDTRTKETVYTTAANMPYFKVYEPVDKTEGPSPFASVEPKKTWSRKKKDVNGTESTTA
jgi:hypothetical protein